MIIGIGIDIIEISRIENISSRAFYKKIFTDKEYEYLKTKGPESTAGYFCAKEAVSKALGTGFSGFKFNDIEIVKKAEVPYAALHGEAARIAKNKGIAKIFVSISHSKIHATATAIAVTEEKTDVHCYFKNICDGIDSDLNNGIHPRIHCEDKIVASLTRDKKVEEYPLSVIKTRNRDSHKGDYGKVCIIGGSYEMSGAVILSAKAALRAGAGLVTCVIPNSLLDRVGTSVIEATYFACEEQDGLLMLDKDKVDEIIIKSDVIAIGMGLGKNYLIKESMEYLILNSTKPIVIDADGLNLLSEIKECLKKSKAPIVLTPHLGEMARLTGKSIEEINNDKQQIAIEFAREYKAIVLLKGNKTIVTDGNKVYINNTGNAGMATGGSGDVLTGAIAAFVGQNYNVFDAAALGAFVHGAAGDIAYRKYGYGLIAGDIIENLSFYLKE
jgi:hydroxyethylthiazole kinase-like uncharacterized protein yjeF